MIVFTDRKVGKKVQTLAVLATFTTPESPRPPRVVKAQVQQLERNVNTYELLKRINDLPAYETVTLVLDRHLCELLVQRVQAERYELNKTIRLVYTTQLQQGSYTVLTLTQNEVGVQMRPIWKPEDDPTAQEDIRVNDMRWCAAITVARVPLREQQTLLTLFNKTRREGSDFTASLLTLLKPAIQQALVAFDVDLDLPINSSPQHPRRWVETQIIEFCSMALPAMHMGTTSYIETLVNTQPPNTDYRRIWAGCYQLVLLYESTHEGICPFVKHFAEKGDIQLVTDEEREQREEDEDWGVE